MVDYHVDAIRSDYQALNEVCYLNTGTVGIMSESVLGNHLHRIASYERYGHVREADAREGYEQSRTALADLINASPAEIALTRNASDGVNYVLSGLRHPPHTTMITTSEEHPAVLLPVSLASRSIGGRVHLLDLSGSDDELLTRLSTMVRGGDVSLAIISHVSCETGRRLPISEMCAICREYGVLTLVDGAQSVGQIDVDVAEIGCDFMTGNGHKWLCGPKGTGFLYIRKDRIGSLTPPYAGDGSVDPKFDRSITVSADEPLPWRFREDAQRFEFGTRNWHLFGAVADAISHLDEVGWKSIQHHVAGLTESLKSELSVRESVNVKTPESWEQSCGIVTFTVDGWDGVELSNRLWKEHQIIQRRVQIPSGVRISCAHYTSGSDIEQFLSALDVVLESSV